ncbi:MAG: hypothetical protein WCR21_12450, partial [Bacteroidota bacterium]
MKISKKLMILGIGSLLLVSCSGNKDHDNTNESADSTALETKDTISYTANDTTKFKFDFAIANIPSPANTLQDIGKWGVVYDNSILNDTKKLTHYTTEFERSINLGVYNIDMAYAIANDNGVDVLQYMKSVLNLSDALGLKGAMNAMVGKRAQENINNKDNIITYLKNSNEETSNIYENIDDFKVLSSLTLLTKIQPYQKLLIKILESESEKSEELNTSINFEIRIDNSMLQPITRWINSQGRNETIDYINKLID